MTPTYIHDEWALHYDTMRAINVGDGYYWKHYPSMQIVGYFVTNDEANEAMDAGEVQLEEDTE